MRIVILALVCLIALANTASAGLIFTIVPDGVDTFMAGQTGKFQVFVRSDVATGEQVISLSLNVNAGVGDGSAGIFSSGTTNLLGGVPFDVATTPGQAFSTNFNPASTFIPFADGVGANLGVLHGVLELDTTGVAAGTYNMTLDQLDATPFWNGVPPPPPAIVTSAVNTTFTISVNAVPEPTSMALIGLAGVVAVRRFRQRTKRS